MDIQDEKEPLFSTNSSPSDGYDENPAKRSRIDANVVRDLLLELQKPEHSQIGDEVKTTKSEIASTKKLLDNFVPLNSLPSAEAAISIQKIRQRILHYCSPNDLLRFRHVSRDWRREATNDTLLNWNRNNIRIERKGQSFGQFYAHVSSPKGTVSMPLRDLTELLKPTSLNPFPFSRFKILYDRTGINDETELELFLNNHGTRIKTLYFNLKYFKHCDEIPDPDVSCMFHTCSHSEMWIIQFFTKLIVEQSENLESLKFVFGVRDCIHGTPCTSVISLSTENDAKNNVERLNAKLKTVSFLCHVPRPVFDLFCHLAPNLKCVTDCDLIYYLEPINRLHLLRHVTYRPGSLVPDSDLHVERIANIDMELRVTELIINTDDILKYPKDWLHVANICNKLFAKFTRSLKKFYCSPMGFLSGLKIPKMSNVNHITIAPHGNGKDRVNPGTKFFPSGMRMSDKFPKLREIRLGYKINNNDIAAHFDEFLLGCHEDIVPSVKKIYLLRNLIDLELFQRWFPNAEFVG